ncbi:MAG: hypothetical protein FD130_208 [Halothiobacillaceae bacterium]|nr:MAG: hypothetical protein FD130_208 [Halothiobacillaceae bacterium]
MKTALFGLCHRHFTQPIADTLPLIINDRVGSNRVIDDGRNPIIHRLGHLLG